MVRCLAEHLIHSACSISDCSYLQLNQELFQEIGVLCSKAGQSHMVVTDQMW
jgi:hypothetical protein